MESAEQEKGKQNQTKAGDQDNMATESEFIFHSALSASFTKYSMFVPLFSAASRIDTLSQPKPVPVGFTEDRSAKY